MGKDISMDLDLGSIPGPAAQRLHGLLTESNFFEISDTSNLMTSPDEYQYTITVVAGNSIRTIHVTDTSMPESLRPLVEKLAEIAKATT